MIFNVFFSFLAFFSFSQDPLNEPYSPKEEFRVAQNCLRELQTSYDLYPNKIRQLERAVYSSDELSLGSLPYEVESLRADIKACQLWIRAFSGDDQEKMFRLRDGTRISVGEALASDQVSQPPDLPVGIASIRLNPVRISMFKVNDQLIENEFVYPEIQNLPEVDRTVPKNHGYPLSSVNDLRSGCSSEGFIDRLSRPMPPAGLFSKGEEEAMSFLIYDRDCRTPSQVSLKFNGRKYEVTCGGTRDLEAKYPGFKDLHMCDPMLYGFYPLKNQSKGSAECVYPGMSGGEDSQLRPHRDNYICNHLSQRVSEKIRKELRARKTPYYKDHSLKMAAQLALENPYLWKRKVSRINDYCRGKKTLSRYEQSSCKSLLERLTKVEAELVSWSYKLNDEVVEPQVDR